MRVSLVVQHHPARSELLPALLSSLRPASVQVARDPAPDAVASAWRTYRHALELTPAWATHRVVIQDDAIVCRDFAPTLERAIAARPDRMLVLCVCGQPVTTVRRMYRASEKGEAWVLVDLLRWVPAIAVVWPARLIRPALEFVDAQEWPARFCADDEILARIARGLKETVLASVPSLVDHPDLVPSVAGRRAGGGRNLGRVGACFVDADCEPLSISWELGPE